MSFEIIYKLRHELDKVSKRFHDHHISCIPSSFDPRDYKYGNLTAITAVKPETIDYRSQLPPVFDQQRRGSCVACASSWTIKAYQEIKDNDYPEGGFSPAFLYTLCKQNDGMPSQEGTQPKIAMRMLQKYGICPENIMPYSSLTELPVPDIPSIDKNAYDAALPFKIQSYAQLCSAYDIDRSTTLSAFRQALANEGPFLICILICENFEPDSNNTLPLPQGQVSGGHAVGIVGDLPERECLILRNSWGSAWGDNGYAYLPYDWVSGQNNMGWFVFEAWTATNMKPFRAASKIVIIPGHKYVKIDGKRVGISQPVIADKSKSDAMVPIQSLAEAMGYQVEWDGHKIVLIRI